MLTISRSADHTAANMADIVHDNVCNLDKMPAEVRQKIFRYAIKLQNDITPFQVKKRANKFFWDKGQKEQKSVSAVPGLTAVHLSRCNKRIYSEVATTHLFYKVNQYVMFFLPGSRADNLHTSSFDFTNVAESSRFIAAITPNRAMAIQSVSTVYGYLYWHLRYYIHPFRGKFTN